MIVVPTVAPGVHAAGKPEAWTVFLGCLGH